MKSITEVRCAHCRHQIIDHAAEGEIVELPGKMPCREAGCECVDFHWCGHCPACRDLEP